MPKWNKIKYTWKYERPKYFWSHWFHDVYHSHMPWWADKKEPRKYLCRTCKVWWQDFTGKVLQEK